MFLDKTTRTAPAHKDVQETTITVIGIMIREMITVAANMEILDPNHPRRLAATMTPDTDTMTKVTVTVITIEIVMLEVHTLVIAAILKCLGIP